MVLEESKLQGVVGALLMAIGSAFPLIGIVGVALMLRAFKVVAEYYGGERHVPRGPTWIDCVLDRVHRLFGLFTFTLHMHGMFV